jgi:hypothetical protein
MLPNVNEKYSVCKIRLFLFFPGHDGLLYVHVTPKNPHDVHLLCDGKEIRPLETSMAVLFSFCDVFTR